MLEIEGVATVSRRKAGARPQMHRESRSARAASSALDVDAQWLSKPVRQAEFPRNEVASSGYQEIHLNVDQGRIFHHWRNDAPRIRVCCCWSLR
jgi:hypothetical protein